jgi:hypothetical protein
MLSNSVLFSLKELRRLEDERVRAEADARMAKAEAERRARAEAEQRARDEERHREDRLRVEEAERRARVEGELKLREQQLQGHRFGRPAWMAAAAGAALCVAVGGGLAAWASRLHQAEKKALEREIARRDEQARAARLGFDAQIRALEDAKDRARILGDLQRQKQAIEAIRPRPPRRMAPPMQPTAAPPKPPFHVPRKPEINDDPLGDLPAVKSGGF